MTRNKKSRPSPILLRSELMRLLIRPTRFESWSDFLGASTAGAFFASSLAVGAAVLPLAAVELAPFVESLGDSPSESSEDARTVASERGVVGAVPSTEEPESLGASSLTRIRSACSKMSWVSMPYVSEVSEVRDSIRVHSPGRGQAYESTRYILQCSIAAKVKRMPAYRKEYVNLHEDRRNQRRKEKDSDPDPISNS